MGCKGSEVQILSLRPTQLLATRRVATNPQGAVRQFKGTERIRAFDKTSGTT